MTKHSTQDGQLQRDRKPSLPVVDHVSDRRMRSAGVRAVEAYQNLRKKTERLLEEMDEVTPAHGVPTTGLSAEDSVVTSVAAVIASHRK